MKYQIKILLISICILGIGLSQDKYKNVVSEGVKKVHVDPDTQHWDKEDKNVKDPELQKLLEALKIEFKSERDDLKNQYKKKVDALKKEYAKKRKNLRKKYRKNKKKKKSDKKPEKLNPDKNKEKIKPGEVNKEEKNKKKILPSKTIDKQEKTIDKK